MVPVIFHLGPVKLYSFGLMVMVAFLVGGWMTTLELRRRRIEPTHLEGYPILALLGGLLGARIYFLVEHWQSFFADPFHTLVSGAGLTWYGGALGGALAVLLYAHHRRQPGWSLCDVFAPGLAAAYGIGRIGCQLAGDGDYGPPANVPWAMSYPHGIVPTDVPVHPTPVYEILMMAPIVWILWKLRLRDHRPGWLFGVYLSLVGIERWIAEFYRVRPEKHLGMSTAQWISLAALAAGLWLIRSRSGSALRPAQPDHA